VRAGGALLLRAASCLLWLAPAHAQPARAYDWLRSYDVITACPSEQAFRHTLQQRLDRPLSEAFARMRLELRVVATAEVGTLLGRLNVKDAAGVVTTREVESGSCASIIEALSLVAALSGDGSPPPELVPMASEPRDDGAAPPGSRAQAGRISCRARAARADG
jgi:hypothetical protein